LPGAERRADDFYATPAWCVRALLKGCALPGGSWLEPTAGNGAIARAVLEERDDVRWRLVECRGEEWECLACIPTTKAVWHPDVSIADFLKWERQDPEIYKVALGNPPFSLALEIVQHAMTMAHVVCMLLRVNFLASQKRAAWMREHTPSIYVLPRRPSFTNKGTDATEYAWFVWGLEPARVVVLDPSDCK
jgi:hypothetical protein